MSKFFALFLLLTSSCLASATNTDTLFSLINARLSYMKDVAGSKAENHLAVEDLAQESKVLTDSLAQAEELGFDAESVKPFLIAQMDAAKAIQYRYFANWLSQPETTWIPLPLAIVRPRIASINTQLLTELKALLVEQKVFDHQEFTAFCKKINIDNLSSADQHKLFTALQIAKLQH